MSIDLGDYKDVPARLGDLREKHPDGSLQPADLSKPFDIVTIGEHTYVVYVAACYRSPDDSRPGIAMAWEQFPGKTPYTRNSELQNAETSAWGRAIVAALASESKHVASREDIERRREESVPEAAPPVAQDGRPVCASCEKVIVSGATRNDQRQWVHRECRSAEDALSAPPAVASPASSSEVGATPPVLASDTPPPRGQEAEEAERLHRPEPVPAKSRIERARAALPKEEVAP